MKPMPAAAVRGARQRRSDYPVSRPWIQEISSGWFVLPAACGAVGRVLFAVMRSMTRDIAAGVAGRSAGRLRQGTS